DDEEETEDEFVHTPQNYVPNYDETNDESSDVTREEYKKINEELYGNQVKDDAQATQKTEGPIPSSSISYDYAAKYLNIDNIPPTDTKVVSMMDINVQHEVPHTSSLLTIPVSVIPEQSVINQFETVTTTSAPTIYLLISSLYPVLQQIAQIPTPTTTKATTSTTIKSTKIPSLNYLSAFEVIVSGTPNLHMTCSYTNFSACLPFTLVRGFASTHLLECSMAMARNFRLPEAVGRGPKILIPPMTKRPCTANSYCVIVRCSFCRRACLALCTVLDHLCSIPMHQ
ncbi:hypothetical protein Tco_1519749, partial [Tanacetum coccineum]